MSWCVLPTLAYAPPLFPQLRKRIKATCNGNAVQFQCWINRQSKHRDGRSTTHDPEAFYCHDPVTTWGYLLVTQSFDGQNHADFFQEGIRYQISSDFGPEYLNWYVWLLASA